jgi:hypothetical protein
MDKILSLFRSAGRSVDTFNENPLQPLTVVAICAVTVGGIFMLRSFGRTRH